MLAYAFKTLWYPNFVPTCHVTKVRVFAWKIVALDPASQTLIIRRLKDDSKRTVKGTSFSNHELLCAEDCIKQMQILGFSLEKQDPVELVFRDEYHKASST